MFYAEEELGFVAIFIGAKFLCGGEDMGELIYVLYFALLDVLNIEVAFYQFLVK